MFSQKLFRWMHKVALFAMVFASLAPSISHALASQSNAKGFLQEVCNASGQKFYIQVVTAQGQAQQTVFDVESGSQHPISFSHHMDHCPFCHAGVMDAVVPEVSPMFALYLEQLEKHIQDPYQTPLFTTPSFQAPLTRAPPALHLSI
ncbi:MAG: DUF2946 domain-containing protein [Methylophilus sp.]|nr:DUF2946 domain-containing protein [Methylophilus sp.]